MRKPDLEASEREIKTFRANRTQGGRAVGGHLLLTSRRLVFYPHGFDSATGGKTWQCNLTDIVEVDVAPRGLNPFDGSMRSRLRIATRPSVELFVVPQVAQLVGTIQGAIAQGSAEQNSQE